MKRHLALSTTILTLSLLATSAFAAPLADVNLGAGGVDFALKAITGGSVSLTVSGPGDFSSQKTFDAGQAPFLSLFHKDGSSLEAGYYKWTLVENPAAGDDRQNTKALAGRSQSGGFTVLAGGSIADPDLPEGGFNKDQVFLDDLIVDGSACIGQDCVNGENFGFDTIRLKENNLRIKFQDTSSSASFPSVDWQITANDSSNGGANKFSIDDIDGGRTPFTIEAGSISNALYVDSDGDVGVGPSSPVVEVHAVDGNTPTVRLEQNGSSGFTPQTWDVAGNETNFFVRDVTNGSKLPFKIKPGAPDDSLFIAADGDVGLGTASPGAGLDVRTTDNPVARFQNTTAGGSTRLAIFNGDGNEWRLTVNGSGLFRITENSESSTELEIDASGNLTVRGTVDVGNTSTGSGAGTSACIDSAGKLCACGSCG